MLGYTLLNGTPPFPTANRTKYIGAYGVSAQTIVDGYIDEVRIYSRLLLSSEVSNIYNQTKDKYQ